MWGRQHIVFTRGQHRDVGVTKMPKVRFPKFSVSVMMTNTVPTFDDLKYYRPAGPVGVYPPSPSRSATATCLKKS